MENENTDTNDGCYGTLTFKYTDMRPIKIMSEVKTILGDQLGRDYFLRISSNQDEERDRGHLESIITWNDCVSLKSVDGRNLMVYNGELEDEMDYTGYNQTTINRATISLFSDDNLVEKLFKNFESLVSC